MGANHQGGIVVQKYWMVGRRADALVVGDLMVALSSGR
jgi:hypothetical protein